MALHCNEQRLAARNAQDASLKLFLCVLLRKQPVVTLGVVSSLGGDKHMGVYLPMYGLELRCGEILNPSLTSAFLQL